MNEQKLIDLCFELVITSTDPKNRTIFDLMSTETKASWVANQLRNCGFETEPCGASWGIIKT